MEETNTNPTGKTLCQLMDDAKERGIQICVVGMGGDIKAAIDAARIAKMVEKAELLIVDINHLPKEDQEKLAGTIKIEQLPPPRELKFEIKNYAMDMPEVFLSEKKSYQQTFPRKKKLKGYMKGNKKKKR